MKALCSIRQLLVPLAVLGVCLPQVVLAAPAVGQIPAIPDVMLGEGGVLYGTVVNSEGAPVANAPIVVRDANQEVARSATDDQGRFAVAGLRGGMYEIATIDANGMFRLWTGFAAPPNAQRGVLLTTGNEMVRGQSCGSKPAMFIKGMCCNPWIVGGLIATAVAVPVAVHNSERPKSP